MSYTADSTSDVGRLRLLLYDVVPSGTSAVYGSNYYFEDADLEALLDVNASDLWSAAADGCRSLAAKFAAEALNLTLDGSVKVDKTKKAEFYLGLAEQYAGRSGLDVSEYMDSANYRISGTGSDLSEYVGDDG